MMVEINFLEQKKNKVFPFLLIGLFVILLLMISVVLHFQASSKEQNISALEEDLQAISPQHTEMENILNLEQSRLALEEDLAAVRSTIFPALPLLDRMVALLPEKAYFKSYVYERGIGLTIDVLIEDVDHAAAYSDALEREVYTRTVDLNSVTKSEQEDKATYIASFLIQIDEVLWMEEAANEE